MQLVKANNIYYGRSKTNSEKYNQFLSKYPKVIIGLKKGYSVRECVKLYDVSL